MEKHPARAIKEGDVNVVVEEVEVDGDSVTTLGRGDPAPHATMSISSMT